MDTSSFRNTKLYHKLNKWDVNVTDINSREDKYQDAVLARLEKEEEEEKQKNKSKRKSKKTK
tara:strand:- start:545 stop:730 length:186 start_codon:yes stop_codon:yes gene_type:complete